MTTEGRARAVLDAARARGWRVAAPESSTRRHLSRAHTDHPRSQHVG